MSTISQLQKQAKKAPKFVLFTNEFGFDMFIADDFDREVMVEKTETAMQFSVGYDNEELKLKTYSALTGYKLQVRNLA